MLFRWYDREGSQDAGSAIRKDGKRGLSGEVTLGWAESFSAGLPTAGRWEHPVFSRIRTSKVLLRPQETPERGVPGRRSASAKVLGRKRAWPLLELGRRDSHRDRSWNWWARINWSPVGLWKPVFLKVPQVIPVCSRDEEPLTRGLATSQSDRKVNDEEYRPRDRTIWLSIPFLPPSGCVIQGTLLKLSVPQFHHLKNGGSREPTL